MIGSPSHEKFEMLKLKAVIATGALLLSSQFVHAEESTLMQNKLVVENHKAIQGENRIEATAATPVQTGDQKKSC